MLCSILDSVGSDGTSEHRSDKLEFMNVIFIKQLLSDHRCS